MGIPPIVIIGFGLLSDSSEIRVPRPPASITAFMLILQNYFARKNNEEKYVKWFCKKVEPVENDLISEIILSISDYDFANYFVKKWGSKFKCVDIGKKDVYQFTEQNLWDNNFTCGSKIREMISNEMWDDFVKFQEELIKEADNYDPNTDEYEKTHRKIKLIGDICIKLKKTSDKNNILTEILNKIEDPNFEKDLNKQKYILPIKNGKIIDMNTLEIQERTIEHKFNYECDANYIEMTEEEENDIKQYFLDLFCGNEDTMLRVLDILKSIFTGETLRYIYFFTGEGSNGKSLLFTVLKKIFGKAMDTIDTRVILESKSASSLTTEFEKLDKCRLGFVTELEKTDKLNVKTIKKISGGDPIDFRGLYKTNTSIIPTTNLCVLTNELPDFTAQTAIINRIIVIPFNNTFEVNKSFETELLGKRDQIFTFIMKYGTIRDKFELTEEMKIAKQDYVDNNEKIDYLKDYIEAFYEIVPFVKPEKITRDKFRDGYNTYLKLKGQPIDKSTHNKFTKDIKKYNIGTLPSNGKTYYTGLIERVEEIEEDEDI
jgi:P4 family phage/plasmid primase-like protien